MKILADSGLFIGLFDSRDEHHKACDAFMTDYKGVLITCWAAFNETQWMLSKWQLQNFYEWAGKLVATKRLVIEHPPAEAVMPLWQLLSKYDDLPMDFCDATLVYLATTLKIDRIATVDRRDFTVYRLPHGKKFVHVLEPYQASSP